MKIAEAIRETQISTYNFTEATGETQVSKHNFAEATGGR
jgi:hypothetical protein